jgi:hypothetical protein
VDLSFYKNFSPSWLTSGPLGEAARIQLRFEMFNAFNTTQFRGDSLQMTFYNGLVGCGGTTTCDAANNIITSNVVNTPGGLVTTPAVAAGDFGIAGRTRGAREIQYALKLYF